MRGSSFIANVVRSLLLAATLVVVQAGGCHHGGVAIQVRSIEDVKSRQDHPNTETVTLILHNGFSSSREPAGLGLLLTDAYSCTVLKSADNGPVYTISSSDDSPALTIQGASNILISRVDFTNGVNDNSPNCNGLPYQSDNGDSVCPAVVIYNSANVMLVQGSVHGRVDMFQAERSSLDGMKLTSTKKDTSNVNVAMCGDGPSLRKCMTSVTNSEISGAPVGVWLYQGAVGVSITNNDFHNFGFSAIRCGLGQHNVGDCMLNTMSYNYIHTDPQDDKLWDNSGIYFATHWINPGNYLSCNYVEGGEHCLYLDWASSGITIEGGVCHNNVNGLKLNTGHSNTVSSLIVSKSQGLAGWISCQNYDINNCDQDPGSFWEQQRVQSYSSAEYSRRYPWMNNLCSERAVSGIYCNPSGSAPADRTGACSGLPTNNQVSLTLVDPIDKNTPTYLSCDPVPVAQKINNLDYHEVSSDSAGFQNSPTDFGVTRQSKVYNFSPNFKSCPRNRVGPQEIDLSSFQERLHL